VCVVLAARLPLEPTETFSYRRAQRLGRQFVIVPFISPKLSSRSVAARSDVVVKHLGMVMAAVLFQAIPLLNKPIGSITQAGIISPKDGGSYVNLAVGSDTRAVHHI
jgi:hypothetical protein